jgi:hypothetical protein
MYRIGTFGCSRLARSPTWKSGGSYWVLFAYHSVSAPKMSPVASETPFPESAPGVLVSIA